MPYELQRLGNDSTPPFPIDADELRRRIEELLEAHAARYRRLWLYYRNPMLPRTAERDEQGSDRPYRQAQEWGLPSRVTGSRSNPTNTISTQPVDGVARKEVVIENDIAWRVDTMIDFLFGGPLKITSNAADPARREQIESLLTQIFTHNGGQLLLQQLALLGAVHGFVDVLVKLDTSALSEAINGNLNEAPPDASHPSASTEAAESAPSEGDLSDSTGNASASTPLVDASRLPRIARCIRLEVVEPARALPILSDVNWREVQAYVQVYQTLRRSNTPRRRSADQTRRSGFLARLLRSTATAFNDDNETITVTEILTADRWQRYEDERLVDQGANSLGEIPLVHIQNLAVPFQYAGASDVEALIPLQDELNTRLSDRANRITMQSFKMYLGKGIDGFTELPVAPGRMWMTDNDAAEVIEFGGDAGNPSEDRHITELREAMDKISAVTPIAAGAIRGRVGNLTSAAALRVTMMALLAKTQRKRTTYGQAIARMCELSLAWLDQAGLFRTSSDERSVRIEWPELLPELST